MNKTNHVTDPVCGMTIDPANAVGSSRYNNEIFHFCSRGCETKFDATPEIFANRTADAACCSTTGHSCC